MKKQLLSLTMILLLIFTLTGCGSTSVVAVNVESSEESSPLSNNILGMNSLIEIGNYLYYDSTTGIVYWWNGYMDSNWSITPSPYYSPNGLLYRYIPETNTLEEIKPLKIADEKETTE